MSTHRLLLGLLASLSCIATSASARAADSPPPPPRDRVASATSDAPPAYEHGYQVALQGGYGMLAGNAERGTSLSGLVGNVVPIDVSLGYKFTRHWTFDARLGLSFGGCGDDRIGGESCTSIGTRLGPDFVYAFRPDKFLNPWIGLGAAFTTMSTGGPDKVHYTGFDFAHVMFGVDGRYAKAFGIGPYVDFGAGTFLDRNASPSLVNAGAVAANDAPSVYYSMTIGARITFMP
ncbi:MAG TPA: hypothetical protein VF407_14900 [Polyangiaceae bacterium]